MGDFNVNLLEENSHSLNLKQLMTTFNLKFKTSYSDPYW
jgi:hypothetical protein